MIKVLTILGTRPEAIKLAPVLRELDSQPQTFNSRVVTTGQHREMLDPMLDLFDIQPDYDLRIMSPRQSLTDVTLAAIAGLEPILADEKPDWVLVQGDTTSVMAASIASFYQKVPVGHVEAGLRTFDKYSPYPEEINRRIAGVLADLHFAPTAWARENLLREGVPPDHVRLTGNTVIDAMDHVEGLAFDLGDSALAALPAEKRLVLVTAHRNENFGFPMEEIALAVRDLARNHDDIHIVYPLHLNPRARKSALRRLTGISNISLLPPLEYRELVWVLRRAHLVLTDSGGIQEEAAGAGTPALVLRDTTERPEGIESGVARLVRPEQRTIVRTVERLLEDDSEYEGMSAAPCPYGDGKASRRIVDALAGLPEAHTHEHIYEQPSPVHPLDALLRDATVKLPRNVFAQFRRTSRRVIAGTRG